MGSAESPGRIQQTSGLPTRRRHWSSVSHGDWQWGNHPTCSFVIRWTLRDLYKLQGVSFFVPKHVSRILLQADVFRGTWCSLLREMKTTEIKDNQSPHLFASCSSNLRFLQTPIFAQMRHRGSAVARFCCCEVLLLRGSIVARFCCCEVLLLRRTHVFGRLHNFLGVLSRNAAGK